MTPRTPLASLLVAFAVSGCITQAREAELGADAAKKVEQQMGLLDDPVKVGYVRAVAKRLAAESDRPEGPWSFEIADSDVPNAFALPGGHVYVTRGLLALVNSEDELAGVIGHEMGHVTARHSAKRVGVGVLTAPVALASAIASFGVGLVSPTLANVVAGTGQLVTGGLVIAPFSRSQENEADEIGQALAARAGYDPAGISHFMRTLKREGELRSSQERSFHILDTHPLPEARARKTEERARELKRAEVAPVAGDKAALFAKLDGLLVGSDPAHGVFEDNRFLHPGLDLTLELPSGWKTVNTPQAAGAVTKEKDALVALRFVAKDTTLDAVLEQARQEDRSLHFERKTVHGLPTAHTRQTGRGQLADLTLIGYGGNVYSIVGQCAEGDAGRFEPEFARTAGSFRALRSSERSAIEESRLRQRKARAGETAAALVDRTGSTWSAGELAVANAVDESAGFEAGQPVKVAVPEPFRR